LREPVLYAVALARALEAGVSTDNSLRIFTTQMGQQLLYPASVFSYFPVNYEIPGTSLNGPEFQIFTPSTAIYRANFANVMAFSPQTIGLTMDTAQWEQLASDPSMLVEALNQTLMYGRMSSQMRTSIIEAIDAIWHDLLKLRVQTAIYLVASSSQYQVQR
jgi:hypothetical protein